MLNLNITTPSHQDAFGKGMSLYSTQKMKTAVVNAKARNCQLQISER